MRPDDEIRMRVGSNARACLGIPPATGTEVEDSHHEVLGTSFPDARRRAGRGPRRLRSGMRAGRRPPPADPIGGKTRETPGTGQPPGATREPARDASGAVGTARPDRSRGHRDRRREGGVDAGMTGWMPASVNVDTDGVKKVVVLKGSVPVGGTEEPRRADCGAGEAKGYARRQPAGGSRAVTRSPRPRTPRPRHGTTRGALRAAGMAAGVFCGLHGSRCLCRRCSSGS